ncbi:MAG: hypothetical protein IPL63_06555 [Saprospiraceae bacterium]|nr:hypothetical protein [Saprospiraceae bacterium]MBK6564593.1 hypothetical protein [Saprospiraceae bacterium]MBK8079326.1 hypothetical protein [Saprospiraceae bacterium]MBK8371776.1 hypothetical protein [Saprospiraceae bacterium]MBK8547040.1 hypothetical protein [Saprospiraceae bacterium]
MNIKTIILDFIRIINHNSWVFLVFTMVLFLQCKKEDNYLYEGRFETDFVIPAGLSTILTHYITIRNVYTDASRNATNNGQDVQNLKSVQASFGRMFTLEAGNDLDFIQELSVTLISRTNPNLKIEMYYSEFVPFTVDNEIRLQSGSLELKEILKDDYVDIEIRMNLRNFVPNTIKTRLNMSYIVL